MQDIVRAGGDMLVTNICLYQEKIGKDGMKVASGRKTCRIG